MMCTAVVTIKYCPLWQSLQYFLTKLNTELPYVAAISLLNIYIQNDGKWDICAHMFTALWFTTVKNGYRPSVQMDEWTHKMSSSIMEYNLALKDNKIVILSKQS